MDRVHGQRLDRALAGAPRRARESIAHARYLMHAPAPRVETDARSYDLLRWCKTQTAPPPSPPPPPHICARVNFVALQTLPPLPSATACLPFPVHVGHPAACPRAPLTTSLSPRQSTCEMMRRAIDDGEQVRRTRTHAKACGTSPDGWIRACTSVPGRHPEREVRGLGVAQSGRRQKGSAATEAWTDVRKRTTPAGLGGMVYAKLLKCPNPHLTPSPSDPPPPCRRRILPFVSVSLPPYLPPSLPPSLPPALSPSSRPPTHPPSFPPSLPSSSLPPPAHPHPPTHPRLTGHFVRCGAQPETPQLPPFDSLVPSQGFLSSLMSLCLLGRYSSGGTSMTDFVENLSIYRAEHPEGKHGAL